MSLACTALVTDERRAVSVRLPAAIDATIDDARHVAFKSARAVEEEADEELELQVNLTEVTERAIWLEITGFASADADVADIETKIRTRGLVGLLEKELLPAQAPFADAGSSEGVGRGNPWDPGWDPMLSSQTPQ
jgi:hypothetical protein